MLEILSVSKSYSPQTPALRDVTLRVEAGEIVCLLGPSGSGKSTLLRIVAGLEQADSGRVLVDGKDMAETPIHRRGFGLMFQDFALFPDKSVAANVAFGLRMAGWSKERIDRRVAEMLDLVSLGGYGGRSIFQLSGGERQRVALARSLAPSPRLLMLDEPLGSLDRTLRESLLDELRVLLKRVGLTSLYVTHDQQEALAIADRVAILNHGQVVQFGAPREVHQEPASPFVARFLGLTNLIDATVSPSNPGLAHTMLGDFPMGDRPRGPGCYTLLLRPTAAALANEAVDGPSIVARITEMSYRGAYLRVEAQCRRSPGSGAPGTSEVSLIFHLPADAELREGDEVTLRVDPKGYSLLPPA